MLKTALNSPWALQPAGGKLYIAMAGPHQVWVLDEKAATVTPYAGSGREDIRNGPLMEGAMAQPSGLATDGKFLYAVDSEGSAVRRIDLDPGGDITTIVGTSDLGGRSLFEFGDRDGIGDDVRLQHPLGIAHQAGKLYIADSYNHKIKIIDLKKHEAVTWLGNGNAGSKDDPPEFSEPAGLSIAAGRLFVADTNNHLIRVADLKTGKVSTLRIAGLVPPKPARGSSKSANTKDAVALPLQKVKPGATLAFEFTPTLPAGYKLNKLAPVTFRIQANAQQSRWLPMRNWPAGTRLRWTAARSDSPYP